MMQPYAFEYPEVIVDKLPTDRIGYCQTVGNDNAVAKLCNQTFLSICIHFRQDLSPKI